MSYSAYDLRQFYAQRSGRLIRRLLSGHIAEFWPDIAGQRILGYGYALPYLRPMAGKAACVAAAMPARGGAHAWPEKEKNLVCLSAEGALPFETESVDRLLVVHGLEFAELPEPLFHEFWRVLKSGGRMLIIVPSRLGLWARMDWTPFGHGTPYTTGQIADYLRKSMFTVERRERALFMPPFRSFLVLHSAYTFESFGKFIFPGLAGVHLVEAGKQIYAGSLKHAGGKERAQRVLVNRPAPT